jgi:hypothetical protein
MPEAAADLLLFEMNPIEHPSALAHRAAGMQSGWKVSDRLGLLALPGGEK